MLEQFQPVALGSNNDFVGRLTFSCRLAVDLQVATVYQSLRSFARGFSGAVLDVGCGASPYKFLFDVDRTQYTGIDIEQSIRFGYSNTTAVLFDGAHIPFPQATYDGVICTEVLEHVLDYQTLIDEIYRVMKPGAKLLLTVPWSARFHFIPHDFFRYTPSALERIFIDFKSVKITHRGTDVASIMAKLLVIWFRNLFPGKRNFKVVSFLVAALCTPVAVVLAGIGHASIRLNIGSKDDPLGYSVIAIK